VTHLYNIIVDRVDPDEFLDRLDLSIEDLVRAFSARIESQPEIFSDLIDTVTLDEDKDWLEDGDDVHPLEDEMAVMQQWELFEEL